MARVSMPTSNTRLTFTLNDFSGGLVNTVNDAKMKDNESPDMLNMQFRNDGLLQKRPGTVWLSSTPWGQDLIDVIPYEYAPNQIVMLYLTPNYLCYTDEYGDPYVVWQNEGRQLKYVHYMNQLFFVDGLYLYSYDHNSNKTYKYVNPPEGFTPAPTPTIEGVTKEKYVKHFENGHNECAELYEKWYEPCQYELEDGYKGSNVVPTALDLIEVKGNRLYVRSMLEGMENMVFISDILNPSYFPAGLPIQTPPTDDVITAFHTFGDYLIIGRRDSIYALYGTTNREDSVNQYVLYEVHTHAGMANNNSADRVHHMMFFAGSDGNFYKLTPPSSYNTSLSTTKLNTKLDITMPPFNFTSSDIKNAITKFDSANGLWYVQLGDETLVYNYDMSAWTRYNNIDALNFFIVDNELRFSRRTGSIYRFASKEGNQKYYDEYYDVDAGVKIDLPISAYWTSRNMDFGAPARVKQFRDTYVTSESFEDYSSTINVKYEVDYVDIYESFKVENEISKWDKAIFDSSKFVSRNIDRSLPLMINRRGRTLKVFFGCGYKYWGSLQVFPAPGMVEENQLVYVVEEGKLYVRIPRRDGYETIKDKYFRELTDSEMNQALLVHNVMGVYELKGYR